eukprot:TRINITY_DN39940_c0_g1_i1.p1 TRINITY_DN39940_c0_g1~~TRINITY_DN39940_c0_g1_i1.p1  ORF type:complete len:299 (-),score=29.53 TRINITY_DN39940_c0_g1_i1:201-1097(-)
MDRINSAVLDPYLDYGKFHLNATAEALAFYTQPYHADLHKAHEVLAGLPEFWLLFGHCLFVASLFHRPPFRHYWLVSYWVSFAAGFGGGTLASILLQRPPVWLRKDEIMIVYTICWWLVMYCPADIGFTLYEILPVKIICKSSSNILRARVICGTVDIAIARFGAASITAPLFLGTLSGCGGRLICDVAALAMKVPTPAEIARPSWSIKSAFTVAFFYVVSVHWLAMVPREFVESALITFLLAQGVASDLVGAPVDMTAPFFHVFHSITRIPVPPADPQRDANVVPNASFEAPKAKSQ